MSKCVPPSVSSGQCPQHRVLPIIAESLVQALSQMQVCSGCVTKIIGPCLTLSRTLLALHVIAYFCSIGVLELFIHERYG